MAGAFCGHGFEQGPSEPRGVLPRCRQSSASLHILISLTSTRDFSASLWHSFAFPPLRAWASHGSRLRSGTSPLHQGNYVRFSVALCSLGYSPRFRIVVCGGIPNHGARPILPTRSGSSLWVSCLLSVRPVKKRNSWFFKLTGRSTEN